MPKALTNDQILVTEVVSQKNRESAPDFSIEEYFEIFTSEQILKNQELEYDELIDGVIGGGRDGGIDSFYIFVNGEYVREDFDFSQAKSKPTIDVFLIQSKTSKRFEETAVEKIKLLLQDIVSLSISADQLNSRYNNHMVEKITTFQAMAKTLAAKFPRYRFQIYYATMGAEKSLGLVRQADEAAQIAKGFARDAEAKFEILGASELLDLARTEPKSTFVLSFGEPPISHDNGRGFVGLVSLPTYFNFISDETGDLRRGIFEDNVRDYQGSSVEVNKAIADTLSRKDEEDFWWLNNGVTIISDDASATGKMITIESPQIVNGLQTSTEIFNYLSRVSSDEIGKDSRSVLVRIIVPAAEESRDRVIKATNSQTGVHIASLRSTDRIHRNIEQHLKERGIYYDRKKNFYKNQGRPVSSIISVSQMAQRRTENYGE